jgi:SAM-dependent methyltransferase
VREQRLVFGEDADLYDRARPSYPATLVDDVVAMAGPSGRALDVGCGTGKATVLLAERGLTGAGVEADPAMAEVARLNLAPYPRWTVYVSDFEKWQPREGSFDLVCAAQAWHWLDPAVRLQRAHGLLRPGGWLALWWNRPDNSAPGPEAGSTAALADQIRQIYAELAPGLAEMVGIGTKGQPPHDEIPPGLSFGAPIQRSYPWAKDYRAEEWVALIRTQSDHRLLPPEQLDELTARVYQALTAYGGLYRHRYRAWLWAAQKR